MKMTASLLALACAATLPLALVAQTMSERHVLSVNFVDTRNKNSSFTPNGGDVGVVPVPYLGWNSVQTSTPNGTTLDFYDVDGQYSVLGTPTIEKDAPETWYLGSEWTSESNKVFYSDNNARLFGAYQDVRRTGNGGETTVTVRGLTATATYTLYIYPGTEGNGGTSGKMSSFQVETCGEDSEWSEIGKYKGNGLATVRAEALTETWGSYSNFRQYVQGTPIVWSEGVNYLKVEGITGATGIQIRMPTWNGEQRSGLAAFQLVGTFETRETAMPDGGLVPEVDTAIRVGDGKELILQGSSRTALEVVCVGSFTLRKGEYTGTLERLDFSHVQGDVITDIDLSQVGTVIWPQGNITMTGACVAGSADLVPAGKTLTTLGDVTVNTASGDDEGKFAFTRQNVGWVFGGGESTVSGRLVLADAGSATTTLTVQNGASLTVNSNNTTEGGLSGDNGAVLFAHYPVATTVMITGEDSLFDVPNGVVNLARDGNAQVNVINGATFSAYKLNGDTNEAADSVMTVNGATLALGKAGAIDGSLKMVEATLKLQDGATLTANGDWAIADGSTAGKIQLSGTVTVRPNGKTITLQKLALATDAESATLVIDDSEAEGYTTGGSVILKGAMPAGLSVQVKNATVQSNGAIVSDMTAEGRSTILVSNASWDSMKVNGELALMAGATLTVSVAVNENELPSPYQVLAFDTLSSAEGATINTTDANRKIVQYNNALWLTGSGSLRVSIPAPTSGEEGLSWSTVCDEKSYWTDVNGDELQSFPILSESSDVILTLASGARLEFDAPASLHSLTVKVPEGKATITKGTNGSLKVSETLFTEGSITFTEDVGLNLGKVTIGDMAMLEVPSTSVYTSLINNGTIRFIGTLSSGNFPCQIAGTTRYKNLTLTGQQPSRGSATFAMAEGDNVRYTNGQPRIAFGGTVVMTGGDLYLSAENATGASWFGYDGNRFEQSGGTVHMATSDENRGLLMSFGSSVFTYAMTGGKLECEAYMTTHAPFTMTIENASVKALGIKKDSGKETSRVEYALGTGALLSIGKGGIAENAINTFTITGGTLHAHDNATVANDIGSASGTVTLSADAYKTLTLTKEISGASEVKIGSNDTAGTVLLNGTVGVNVSVQPKATLGGTGTINGTLTFAEGSTLDASTGALTVDGLTLPESGTVTVKVAKEADAGAAVLNVTGADATKAKKFTTDVANTYVVASGTGFVLGRMTTADTDGNSPASGSKLANILAEAQAAAIENGITSVNLVYGQCGGETLTAAQAEAGAELFNNVVTTAADGSTVTVAYDFGISKMAIRDIGETRYVIVGAKVQGAEGEGKEFSHRRVSFKFPFL